MKTINVSLVGVGGQGILLTANMLARTATIAGMDVKKSEIHGMAQRGGSVISSVRFGTEVLLESARHRDGHEVDVVHQHLAVLREEMLHALVVDAAKIAEEVGNARTMNMVIAGALSALTPFRESQWVKAMEESFTGPKAKLLDLNRKAFDLGRAAVAQ